jgi:small subunit ribosomal protein S8
MYIDLLIKIKNAQMGKKESLKSPYSKKDEDVLVILKRNGYIEDFDKKGRGPKKTFEIKLKYEEGNGAINGIKFVSKPSRRIYAGYKDIRPVKRGYGLSVVSTPNGLMSANEAKKNKVGGQLFFEIW